MRVLKGLVLVVGMVLGSLAGSTVHAESIDVNGVQVSVMDYEKCVSYRLSVKWGQEIKWTTIDAYYDYTDAYKLIDKVNEYRKSKGLEPLKTNDHLMQIAMQRALENNVLCNHSSPYGTTNGTANFLNFPYAFGWCERSKNLMDLEGHFKYDGQEFVGAGYHSILDLEKWYESIIENAGVLDPAGAEWHGIGIGLVNYGVSFILFEEQEGVDAAPDSRISDYRVSIQVPKAGKWITENDEESGLYYDSMIGDSPIVGEVEVGARLDDGYKAWIAEKKELLSTAVHSVKLSKKRSGKKTKVTVKFGKTKGTGYEIQYSTKKSMTGATTIKSKSNKKSFSIKGKGKKIWVRVRLVNDFDYGKWDDLLGDFIYLPGIDDDVYGKWSKPVSIKTYK